MSGIGLITSVVWKLRTPRRKVLTMEAAFVDDLVLPLFGIAKNPHFLAAPATGGTNHVLVLE